MAGLAVNQGVLDFEGNSGYGAGGATVTTTTSFLNGGTFYVDSYYGGDGGSQITIGGTLTNAAAGKVYIGNSTIGTAAIGGGALVTASGLANSGSLVIQGNTTNNDAAHRSTLKITGAAPSVWTGSGRISGNAILQFGSGGITSLQSGSSLELDGSAAQILTSGGSASGVSGLANNYGTLLLRGASGYGAGGAASRQRRRSPTT